MKTIPATTDLSVGCHALSEPIRLEILVLLKKGQVRPIDMEDVLDIGQSKLSFHLKVLRDTGLIVGTPSKRCIWYQRDEGAISELKRKVGEV